MTCATGVALLGWGWWWPKIPGGTSSGVPYMAPHPSTTRSRRSPPSLLPSSAEFPMHPEIRTATAE